MPQIARITLYPIKSLDGIDVPQATVLPSGALEMDRRWAIVDARWNYVNGKTCAAVHSLRTTFAEDLKSVTVGRGGDVRSFALPCECDALAHWLGELVGCRCRLVEDDVVGFPDDRDSPGPTIIGAATLAAVASWYEGVDASEVRRRLRANLEIDAPEPFWEDRLALREVGGPEFTVGETIFRGWNVCRRCIVPTRDSITGESTPGFAKRFVEQREASLPAWSPAERFEDFYRAAINTRLAALCRGGTIHVGDEVKLAE
jgi:uncharacterized protein YcbX